MTAIEDYIAGQEIVAANIYKIHASFKRDGNQQKNENYVQTRLARLNEQWEDFQQRHKLIPNEYQCDYNIKDVYASTKEIYQATRQLLDQRWSELQTKKTTSSTSVLNNEEECTPASHLSDESSRMSSFKEHLLRIAENIDEEIDNKDKYYCQQKIKLIEGYWQKYLSAHSIQDEDTYLQVEESYLLTLSKLQKTYDDKSTQDTKKIIKLPQLALPKFNGNYDQWKPFHDLYIKLIHENKMLADVQKLQYLKSNLTGEAANLVQHLSITSENYEATWSLLKNRFNNSRILVSTQLEILLNLQNLTFESSKNLKNMHDRTMESLHALNNLKIKTDSWDPLVVHILTKKLDKETHKLYEQSLNNPKEVQSLENFLNFLESRFQSLDAIGSTHLNNTSSKPSNPTKPSPTKYSSMKSFHTSTAPCTTCPGTHNNFACETFLKMSPADRMTFAKKKRLCTNCLKKDHFHNQCTSKRTCLKCKERHHTLLHQDTSSSIQKDETKKNPNDEEHINSHVVSDKKNTVLLATALIKVTSSTGATEILRCLIDQGSQVSFITEACVQRLKLLKTKIHTSITGIGQLDAGVCNSKVQLQIQSRTLSQFKINISALVLKTLTKILPEQSIKIDNNEYIHHLILADPTFDKPNHIDLILGADVHAEILLDGIIKGPPDSPLAQQTQLGWILSGCTTIKSTNISTCLISQIDFQKIEKYWEGEDINDHNEHLTKDENICQALFQETFTKNPQGKPVVRLPFNSKKTLLGNSRQAATARLLQLERKFKSNPNLQRDYIEFMREYVILNHMERISHREPQLKDTDLYYLPHHAVTKVVNGVTKIRVVFDGSAKTSSGISLNDTLIPGPTIQSDLFSILTKWRQHKIVFVSDIEKMFRQILVDPRDTNYQRILWRESTLNPITEYRLNTVTYGTAPASYLAIRSLVQIAKDQEINFPNAAKAIQNDFYVDDLMTGASTVSGAAQLKTDIITILNGAQMNLRKWASNYPMLLNDIPEEHKAPLTTLNLLTNDELHKTLGINWNPRTDKFSFKIEPVAETKCTKRTLLSETSKLFDPLGWLSPSTVTAKLMFQEIWTTKLLWDDTLPYDILNKWNKFKTELKFLNEIRIPRWFGYTRHTQIELHGFCDASEKAYAAVVYVRLDNTGQSQNTVLIAAKTKVAPLKNKTTLPRLELCGAVLLSNLLKKIISALELQSPTLHAWTDSEIVLAWLQGQPGKWKSYVDHRVTEITTALPTATWRHVKSEDNPADCASRGIMPKKLKNHNLWWNGPAWLSQFNSSNYTTSLLKPTVEEQKTTKIVLTATPDNINSPIKSFIERYSSLTKLIRITTYIRRFINNSSTKKGERKTGTPSIQEMDASLETLIKMAQSLDFEKELISLKKGQPLCNKSQIIKLQPFLDKALILRVGGRLQNSNLSYNAKHPIILHQKNPLSTLIIREAHQHTLHGGSQLTLNYINFRYWILGAKTAVQQVIHQCIRCFRFKTTVNNQLMGALPAKRVTISRPFTNTGVDYAGPVHLKTSRHRGNTTYKGYIAIFVCLATRAIHLEVVSDLTSQAFLAAYKRFVARRGHVRNIYSDNGTNFIGAWKELKLYQQDLKQEFETGVTNHLAKYGTTWHFIPPLSPHFGGLWEAGVKSMKHHLRRIVGETKLTYEELSTVISQIEAALNSRPICPLSNDPEDLTALTPGHFLVGDALLSPPETDYTDINIGCIKKWQLLQKMYQDFWKRWSTEYLARLQQRPKWLKTHENIKIGELVLIKEENLPPTKWKLGRVTATHPGDDQIVRVVTVKTDTSEFKRSLSKLCRLPSNVSQLTPQPTPNQTSPLKRQQDSPLMKKNSKKVPKLQKVSSVNTCTTSPTEQTQQDWKNKVISKPALTRVYKSSISSTTLIIAMTILGLVCQVLGVIQPIKISPFKRDPGIYFEQIGNARLITDEWNVLVYYNLTNYWLELAGIEGAVQNIKSLYTNRSQTLEHSTNILEQFKHKMDNINLTNRILFQGSTRKKRSPFDIIGSFANSAFGLLDQNFARQYEKDIKRFNTNEEYLLNLFKSQTSIAESTINIIKRDEKTITEQFRRIKQQMQLIENSTNTAVTELNRAQTISDLALYTLMIMNNYETTQKMLLDMVMDSRSGNINPLLITPAQLQGQIDQIRDKLPNTVVLPESSSHDDILLIYHLMSATVAVMAQTIILRIKIPLIYNENFQLYKLNSVPILHEEKFSWIIPSTPYLVVNLKRDQFYPINVFEFDKCKLVHDGTYLCQQHHPIYNLQSKESHCEMQLLRHEQNLPPTCNIKITAIEPTWIQLARPNTWIYVLNDEFTFDVICNKQVFNTKLRNSGILNLDRSCSINLPSMTLRSKHTTSTSMNTSFIPTVNLTQQLDAYLRTHILNSSHLDDIQLLNHQIELNELKEKVHTAIQKTQLPQITTHDIHQYTISYTTATILAIIFIVFLIRKFKQYKLNHKKPKQAPPIPFPRALNLPELEQDTQSPHSA